MANQEQSRYTQTAGPFLRFSRWNWTPALSMILPAKPSSASISRMIVPLPIPPKLGLQEHVPRLSSLGVTRAVRAPALAAAAHASAPAWPPPITTTSKALMHSLAGVFSLRDPLKKHCDAPMPIGHGSKPTMSQTWAPVKRPRTQ